MYVIFTPQLLFRERERERERERVFTIWYTMEATVMVQNRPINASEMKAPSKGVKLEVPPKLVRVLAALVTGMCSCVVK